MRSLAIVITIVQSFFFSLLPSSVPIGNCNSNWTELALFFLLFLFGLSSRHQKNYHEKEGFDPKYQTIHCFGVLLDEDDMTIGDDCEEVKLNMSLPKSNIRVLKTDDKISVIVRFLHLYEEGD